MFSAYGTLVSSILFRLWISQVLECEFGLLLLSWPSRLCPDCQLSHIFPSSLSRLTGSEPADTMLLERVLPGAPGTVQAGLVWAVCEGELACRVLLPDGRCSVSPQPSDAEDFTGPCGCSLRGSAQVLLLGAQAACPGPYPLPSNFPCSVGSKICFCVRADDVWKMTLMQWEPPVLCQAGVPAVMEQTGSQTKFSYSSHTGDRINSKLTTESNENLRGSECT